MLDVVFSESFAGTLKYASPIEEFGLHTAGIYTFALGLSMGNIERNDFWKKRETVLQAFFYIRWKGFRFLLYKKS